LILSAIGCPNGIGRRRQLGRRLESRELRRRGRILANSIRTGRDLDLHGRLLSNCCRGDDHPEQPGNGVQANEILEGIHFLASQIDPLEGVKPEYQDLSAQVATKLQRGEIFG
jgi:hypothetical protein